ncbi:DUF488 domain-containing protein [Pontiella agarivorans]|uniref:DUF488 family protein n=1 Tax=Pontiella agarivorans TaxID=3038953 RepID=A0ABU5MVI6_9BACT|nr:DUF488 family protein [Pontiella agarivorans]MDZ8118249.1 DUF488 family protein [Pontiella agarivorans]
MNSRPERILIKRIYDPPAASDGWRVLVDRLWPRGVAKENAEIDEWAKELSPSPELRKWYSHDPEKWPVFSRLYRNELKTKSEQLTHLIERCPKRTLTLLYAAKDTAHGHAQVLQNELKNICHT